MKVLLGVSLALVIAFSCSSPILEKQDFLTYLQDKQNGLVQTIEHGNYSIQLIYKPREIIWHSELQVDSLDSLKNHIKKFDYFTLKISRHKEDPTNVLAGSDDYLSAQKYLNGEIGSDIILIAASDTLRPIEYNFTPTYGTAADASVLVVFNSNLRYQDEDVRILFQDNFFGTGLSSFTFQIDDLKNIPKLKF